MVPVILACWGIWKAIQSGQYLIARNSTRKLRDRNGNRRRCGMLREDKYFSFCTIRRQGWCCSGKSCQDSSLLIQPMLSIAVSEYCGILAFSIQTVKYFNLLDVKITKSFIENPPVHSSISDGRKFGPLSPSVVCAELGHYVFAIDRLFDVTRENRDKGLLNLAIHTPSPPATI